MVLLLELLQPASTVCLQVTVGVAHSLREESGLVADDRIGQLISLPLVIPRPVRECSLNIRELALRLPDGRTTPIVLVKVLLFLAQHF